jgi:hypothetical protein
MSFVFPSDDGLVRTLKSLSVDPLWLVDTLCPVDTLSPVDPLCPSDTLTVVDVLCPVTATSLPPVVLLEIAMPHDDLDFFSPDSAAELPPSCLRQSLQNTSKWLEYIKTNVHSKTYTLYRC